MHPPSALDESKIRNLQPTSNDPMKMKSVLSFPTPPRHAIAIAWVTAVVAIGCSKETPMAPAANRPQLLDDFADPARNKNRVERLLIDDATAGSRSQATQQCDNGVLSVKGELRPGRGVPAFISVVSPLSADGKPQDLTGCEGVRIVVKVTEGILCVQVGSSEIDNYDYHTSAPIAGTTGEFREVRIPFSRMKRAWSEQTQLDLRSVTSLNLVSFSLAKDEFAYEVDEIGFY